MPDEAQGQIISSSSIRECDSSLAVGDARLTLCRLVMYYPVSALVTLFANILQNPQDPNARADLKQMQDVCEFLRSVLDLDELDAGALKFEDGSVNRMVMVCGEFQRIAKLVLDKSEKEMTMQSLNKRKRKTEDPAGPPRPVRRAQPANDVIRHFAQPALDGTDSGCGGIRDFA